MHNLQDIQQLLIIVLLNENKKSYRLENLSLDYLNRGKEEGKLIDAAKRNVLAHLIDLSSRSLCVAEGSITLKSNFFSK